MWYCDSGGIQEEVTVLKKILILRNTTERPDHIKNFGKLCSDSNKFQRIFYIFKKKK